MATYFYYEKERRMMRTAIISYLLNYLNEFTYAIQINQSDQTTHIRVVAIVMKCRSTVI